MPSFVSFKVVGPQGPYRRRLCVCWNVLMVASTGVLAPGDIIPGFAIGRSVS